MSYETEKCIEEAADLGMNASQTAAYVDVCQSNVNLSGIALLAIFIVLGAMFYLHQHYEDKYEDKLEELEESDDTDD